MKHAILKSFPITIPVLLGYVPLGMAFGFMLAHAGYNIFWAILSCITIYSGTGQFIEVSFLSFGTALYEVALITLVLNSRMMFYGLSFLEKYRRFGKRKWYLMFALTDETYALLNVVPPPKGVSEQDFMLAVSFMNQLYWIIGGMIGVTAGTLMKIDTTGIDFVMTVLFVVLAMDQWKVYPSHEPVVLGLLGSVAMLLFFGPEDFMIPALVLITILLIVRRKAIEAKLVRAQTATGESATGESEQGKVMGEPAIGKATTREPATGEPAHE